MPAEREDVDEGLGAAFAGGGDAELGGRGQNRLQMTGYRWQGQHSAFRFLRSELSEP
jgi:hypothetical protein